MKNKVYSLSGMLLISAAVFLTQSCVEENDVPQRTYQLVWSDEFNGNIGSGPDSENWNFDIGTGQNGWGNQELQYYTDRPENVVQDGKGNLVITARAESFGGQPFTSARINTKGKIEQAYGRIEARIRTPYGPGIWPAFWMLGNDIDQVSWPFCGEIDIMELRGQEPSKMLGSLHGPGYSGGAAVSGSLELDDDRFDLTFHEFAVEWGQDYIEFFVDDLLYQRLTPANVSGDWVFDHPFFIILNVAVGGSFVGFPSPEGTSFPQTMEIDYVRVYRQID